MPSISLARQPPHPHRYQQTHHRHTRSSPPTFGETVQHPHARASHHQCRQHLALQRNSPFSLPVAHHRAEMAVFAQPTVETRRRARPTACRQQHKRHSRQSRQKDADNTQDQRQPTRQPHKRPPQRQVRIAAGLSAMPYPRHPRRQPGRQNRNHPLRFIHYGQLSRKVWRDCIIWQRKCDLFVIDAPREIHLPI